MTINVPHGATMLTIHYSPTLVMVQGWIDLYMPDIGLDCAWLSVPQFHTAKHSHGPCTVRLADLIKPPDALDTEQL